MFGRKVTKTCSLSWTFANQSLTGQAPGVPLPPHLIFPNSSSVLLRLNTWPDNGCPILYFVLQYRAISDDGDDQWTLVSNALKPQRRFSISSLKPSTLYQLKMEAHNVAGSTSQDFTFVTLTKDGGKRHQNVSKDLRVSIFIQQIRRRQKSEKVVPEAERNTFTMTRESSSRES